MEGLIYAFSYILLKNKTTKELSVIFKILPTPLYTNLYWNSQYMVLEELQEFKIPMKIFICRKIICQITKSQDTCTGCNKNLIDPNFCINPICIESKKLDMLKLLQQENDSIYSLSKIIEEISTTSNAVPDEIICYKCKKCKKCTPTKKCKLHAICKHKSTIHKRYNNFHYLNKLALKTTLIYAANSILE